MHVCFVALKAGGALRGDASAGIGGAEVQQVRLAHGLARRGLRVSFVVVRDGGAAVVDGLRFFEAYAPGAGLPVLRFFYPRWWQLDRALRAADADVYYQRAAGCETGQVAAFCRRAGRRFVFAAGSDTDCDARLPALKTWRERRLYAYGLRRADCVIAQTQAQVAALNAGFGIDATLIRSAAQRGEAQVARSAPQNPPRIVWVGRLAPEKRPEWVLEVAQQRPEWQFHVVGGAGAAFTNGPAFYQRAARLANVTLHGWKSAAETAACLRAADFLICTSAYEGFPNTFLEAWGAGVPVISTIDPDGVLVANGLGRTGESPLGLLRAIEGYLADPERYALASRRALEHVERHHDPERIVDEYARLLSGFCGELPAHTDAGTMGVNAGAA